MEDDWKTTVILREEHHQRLKALREKTGLSLSDLIRLAVVRYLENEGKTD